MVMPSRDYSGILPNLTVGLWVVTSEVDSTYNCIAWAADDPDNWWWPSGCPDDYWPPGVPFNEEVETFVQAYGTIGYRSCEMDERRESGYEKIAIFAVEKNGKIKVTHAAKLLPNGCWASKLGPAEDIEHYNLRAVEGCVYGKVIRIVKRAIAA